MDWSRKWLVDLEKLVSFDWSSNSGTSNVKMDGSVLEENHLLRSSDCFFLLNWIGAFTLSLLLRLHPKKCRVDLFYQVSLF